MQKAKNIPFGYYKVGRITATIARKAHIKCADIVIDDNHIRHIEVWHGKELFALGMNAFDYVSMVAKGYSEIRKNKLNSILLVKKNKYRDSDTITMELTLNDKLNFWEVKTAQPRRNIKSNLILYPIKIGRSKRAT